jgi:hypothetical protein
MATTTVVPQWLKSTHVTGLDQLGIQVISIALYGEDKFTLDNIAALGDCPCPCAVTRYEKEREFLITMLFGPDARGSDTAFSRARTLRLLLAVLDQANDMEKPVPHFRSLAYFGHDAKAKRFHPPADFGDVFQKWSIYETCEFVHYTLEVAFDAVLHHLAETDIADTDAGRFIASTAEAALRVTSSTLGLGTRTSDWCDRTLGDLIEEAQARQKPIADWHDDPWAESNLIFGLKGQPPLTRLVRAFACLVAILARNRLPPQPFQSFATITADWLGRYRVPEAPASA